MRKLVVAMSAALSVAGCAAQQPLLHWTKPGATQDVFMQDRYACLQRTQERSGAYNTTLFVSCMAARGYKEDANGDLFPPPEAVARPNPFAVLGNALQETAANMNNPQVAPARRAYDQSVADYRNCLAVNPSNANACEGQRQIMEANQRVLSATFQPSTNTSVYVGR
jgi:hypothetical protein